MCSLQWRSLTADQNIVDILIITLFSPVHRPYMYLGSLRDQVIYSDNKEDKMAKGVSDNENLNNMQFNYFITKISAPCMCTVVEIIGAIVTYTFIMLP